MSRQTRRVIDLMCAALNWQGSIDVCRVIVTLEPRMKRVAGHRSATRSSTSYDRHSSSLMSMNSSISSSTPIQISTSKCGPLASNCPGGGIRNDAPSAFGAGLGGAGYVE